jgi:peptide/nickel transport system permease protein
MQDTKPLPPGAADRPRKVQDRIDRLHEQYAKGGERRRTRAEQLYSASQWELMRAKFGKHKLAMASLVILAIFYVVAILADFIAPYDPQERSRQNIFAPPSSIHLFAPDGAFVGPYVLTSRTRVNPATFKYDLVVAEDAEINPIVLFPEVEPYKLMGFIPMNVKLFGTTTRQSVFLLGADNLGRDLFSRVIHASRVSLFVGFGGVIISFLLGVTLGGISGYVGGKVDMVIQRTIELVMSVPQIPLWMALAAAIPAEWTGIQTYFAITIVLSLVGWTGLARVVRGRILSMREEDFVMAARISSANSWAIITRHLIPGFTSYLIVHITIAIPYMILGETTLSFLGIGIRAPDVSWGSLLQQAQDVVVLTNYVWILWPAAFVVAAVVLFNFIGDGLRDAADPYAK